MSRDFWRTIPSYPEYEASIEGDIRNKMSGRVLKGCWQNITGNLPVRRYKVRRIDGTWQQKTGASLVYEAFIGQTSKKIFHINGITSDDRPCNLRAGGKGLKQYIRRDRKPVVVYDRYGNYVKRYPSITAAEKGEKLTRKTITDICKGLRGPMARNYMIYQFDEIEGWRERK